MQLTRWLSQASIEIALICEMLKAVPNPVRVATKNLVGSRVVGTMDAPSGISGRMISEAGFAVRCGPENNPKEL
jgi:hypothetical protein